MGACRETDANKALRSAAREYAKAWDDYKNESRKSAAVGALESAARAFAAATPPHQVETHAGAGREHELKTWPPYFEGVVDGSKTFEVRREDRPFAVGDVLVLREWDPKLERYTGRSTKRSITYLMRGGRFGLERGYVVLGLAAATARNESANADTIAAAAIAYARAVDAADEKSRTAEEYEAANAEARRRLVAAVQREVPATRTEKLLAACGAMGTPEPMESGIPKAGGAPESGYIVELGGWALTPAEQAWLDGVAAKHGLLIGERHGPWNPSQAEVKRAVEHLAGDEPSHRRCTSGCGWAWTGTSTEPCPKCGAERASDEPGGESP